MKVLKKLDIMANIVYLLTVIIIIFDWLAFVQGMDMTRIFMITFTLIGLLRGIRSKQFQDVFNFKPFIIKVKTKENVIELLDAFLLTLAICNNEIMSGNKK